MPDRSHPPGPGLTVCVPADPDGRRHLGAMPPDVEVLKWTEDGSRVDLSAVDLVVPDGSMREAVLEALEAPGRLRVIQTLSAGVDWLVGRVPDEMTVCNARGVYDVPLAEWVVGAILALERGFPTARDAQARGEWVDYTPIELAGRRVVILGQGSIGGAVAERLRPFGVEIVGVARTARDGVLGLSDLDGALPSADVLVNLLPMTSETARLLDAGRLALLPDGALVVNGGRGGTIDTDALVAELQRGRLRAALDVTDPEPLPAGHPLWSLPNALITPHIAGDSDEAGIRAFVAAGEQIRRFAAGQPLDNIVPRYQLR
jgi:phosphoglycerate dehydrogenase-like enzyme